MRCSIFDQLAVMEDSVGEELAASFEIETQLHSSRVRSRRNGARLIPRTVIQHIVELEQIASAACADLVVQLWFWRGDELFSSVKTVRVKPYVLRIGDVPSPRGELYPRLQF